MLRSLVFVFALSTNAHAGVVERLIGCFSGSMRDGVAYAPDPTTKTDPSRKQDYETFRTAFQKRDFSDISEVSFIDIRTGERLPATILGFREHQGLKYLAVRIANGRDAGKNKMLNQSELDTVRVSKASAATGPQPPPKFTGADREAQAAFWAFEEMIRLNPTRPESMPYDFDVIVEQLHSQGLTSLAGKTSPRTQFLRDESFRRLLADPRAVQSLIHITASECWFSDGSIKLSQVSLGMVSPELLSTPEGMALSRRLRDNDLNLLIEENAHLLQKKKIRLPGQLYDQYLRETGAKYDDEAEVAAYLYELRGAEATQDLWGRYPSRMDFHRWLTAQPLKPATQLLKPASDPVNSRPFDPENRPRVGEWVQVQNQFRSSDPPAFQPRGSVPAGQRWSRDMTEFRKAYARGEFQPSERTISFQSKEFGGSREQAEILGWRRSGGKSYLEVRVLQTGKSHVLSADELETCRFSGASSLGRQ